MTHKEKAVLEMLEGVVARTKDFNTFIENEKRSLAEGGFKINSGEEFPYLAGYYAGYITIAIDMLKAGNENADETHIYD